MSEAHDKAVLKELVAIRLFGVDLHKLVIPEPAEGEEPIEDPGVVQVPDSLESLKLGKSVLATLAEAEDSWRNAKEEQREHWRAIAGRLLTQLEEDGVTVRPRAEATKSLRIALTVPAHSAYEIPGLTK